jgi:hypothetical protein
MAKKVFYSWQAQHPGKANRYLIEEALERALKAAAAAGEVEAELEQDARGTIGAQEISSTILEKIKDCDAFIADVTPVGKLITDRPTPNPNVMFELGFAWRQLPATRVVLVLNTAFGAPEDLPFDISKRALVQYRYDSEAGQGPAEARNSLAARFQELLVKMFEDEPVEALRELGLTDPDIELFRQVYEEMVATGRPVLDYARILELGATMNLAPKQVEDAVQVVATAGLWKAASQLGEHRYSHVSTTMIGLERYANAFVPGYTDLQERAARLVRDGVDNSTALREELKAQEILVEHILDVFEHNDLVDLAKDTGGVYIMEVKPKLRRAFEGK